MPKNILSCMLNPIPPPTASPSTPVWRHLYWILAAAFCARAGIALSGDFVLHPDEIMQYLEPAHSAVFGAGLTFWEFHFGARSWLVPGLVAAVLWICKGIGLGEPAFYVPAVKLMFCAISLAIPASMYAAGRRLYGERTGRIALMLGAFWYELVGFAHKPMTEFVATSMLLLLLALMLRPPAPRRVAASAGLAVLTVAVRMQYAMAVGALLAWDFIRSGKRARLGWLLAGLATLAAIGLFEYLTWGGFFQSYYLNLLFNLTNDRSGESTALHYLGWLTLTSGGLFLLAAAAGIWNWRRHLLLLALMLIILLPHMAMDHREYRFVFAIIPIWLMLFANLLAEGWQLRRDSSDAPRRSRPALGWGYAAIITGLGILNLIPGQYHAYASYSSETGLVSFMLRQDPIFPIYRKLARDPSLCGILDVTRRWHNTPGYFYLHQKIPLYDAAYIVDSASPLAVDNLPRYVSHIIAGTAVPEEPSRIYRNSDGGTAIRIGNRYLALPHIMIDSESNALAYMDETGRLTKIGGYAPVEHVGNVSIWTLQHQNGRQGPCQTHIWKDYTPFAGGASKKSIRAILAGDPLLPEAGPQIIRP